MSQTELQRLSDKLVEMEINIYKLVTSVEIQIDINDNVLKSFENADGVLKANNKSIISLLELVKTLGGQLKAADARLTDATFRITTLEAERLKP